MAPTAARAKYAHITPPSKHLKGEAILQELVVARYSLKGYVTTTMLYEFSLPTKADKVPTESDWIHEIKYDGYRMMVIREQERVRLISRGAVTALAEFKNIYTN